ncbi:triple tyrosine motif-containing protein [Sphingobacterium oryzagri]|uniref:Triple tyrosine motif-containing protein n=1 Tax=Sphingobacterium oryzagri TaxID=3025669 RepID=A0ABY7WGH9_9SPHI|nr:triple tyrosine motif-containing protein [Sphingobacterium sp. KACC 22765]WDF67390.1 triple tyrosine motif-containing protein [Sphingobacterium sp. KACC 22765]
MIRLTLVFFILLCFGNTFAQGISTIGSPHVQNFTKAQYKAGNQNWSIAQGQDGILYAANNNGLVTFDGAYWELHPLANRNFVRSVAVAKNGDIYVGGKEEFGYFKKENGRLRYYRVSHLVEPEILENDEIWKILFTKDAVIFQSFSKFYRYKDNKVDVQYGAGEPFLFAHQVNEHIWMERIPSGLESWSTRGFSPIKSKLSNVLSILPFSEGQYLVGTAKDGLYLLSENGDVSPWKTDAPISKLLKEAQLNNGVRISNDLYAFGTIKNGIFIINKQGHVLQHVHKRNGLQNNTVLSMTLDKQGNLWAGLDNGIDRIEINAPFFYYKDIYGELGTVYAIKVFQDRIYLGTNQGLFSSAWRPGDALNTLKLAFIPGSQGQVWRLDVLNNQLICGHNDGTFLVENNSLRRISSYTGGWTNVQLPTANQLFLQGNYTGLALFEDQATWQLRKKFDEPKSAVISVAHKEGNQFWVVFNNALQLIAFHPDYLNFQTRKTFSFAKDFPQVQWITPFSLQGNNIFATDKGIFVYDDVLAKFQSYTELNNTLGSYANAKRILSVGSNSYIFANEGKFARVDFTQQEIKVDSSSLKSLQDMVMKNYEVVEPLGNKLLIGLDNGIAIYDKSYRSKQKVVAPIIKTIQDMATTIDTIQYLDWTQAFSNKQNNLRIAFSSPWYSNSPLHYQYILEGYQSEWSHASEIPYIDFTNLSTGSYTFKVRAITVDGDMSEVSAISFQIAPPWYLQWPALVAYLVLSAILFVVARRLVIEKIKRDKLAISSKLQQRQEEALRKETEQNEKKLMALKNTQLTQELEAKNRELANAATNIVYKNELLNNLNEELLNLKDRDGKKLSADQLQRVNKLIDNARSDERDWDLFEKSFNESHENFFKKLKTDYPELSPNDLKLCAYLRLNMSSKDMASLMNISTRGIEVRRYRLRKKFNLPTEKNLSEFLLEL